MSCSVGVRALALAWLGPAVALAWTGLAALGWRTGSAATVAVALDRIQAVSVMLAILTVIGGAMWAVRSWPRPESWAAWRPGPAALAWHGSTLMAFVVSLCVALASPAMADIFIPAAAACAFGAASAGPRLLLRSPVGQSLPVITLAVLVTYQTTMGWLHVTYVSAGLAWLLVVEGLMLAGAATAAARVISGAGLRVEATRPVTAATSPLLDTTIGHANEPTVDLVSQAPALPSLPGPAVGH